MYPLPVLILPITYFSLSLANHCLWKPFLLLSHLKMSESYSWAVINEAVLPIAALENISSECPCLLDHEKPQTVVPSLLIICNKHLPYQPSAISFPNWRTWACLATPCKEATPCCSSPGLSFSLPFLVLLCPLEMGWPELCIQNVSVAWICAVCNDSCIRLISWRTLYINLIFVF